MFSYQARQKRLIEPGWLYGSFKSVRRRELTDCLSLCSIQDGWMIHKDGSVGIGFEMTPFEEERLDEDGFDHFINTFAAACKRLPTHTLINKLDIYYDSVFDIPIPVEAPFFYKKSLMPYHQRKILAHRSLLFLRFFVHPINPVNSFLGLGRRSFFHPFLDLDHSKQMAASAIQEFIALMPTGLKLKQLDDLGHQQILYQCASLCFDRMPIGFERSYQLLSNSIAMGDYVKSVSMKTQADSVYCCRKNTLGFSGVTSPFMWPLTHALPFPHIVSQQITLIL